MKSFILLGLLFIANLVANEVSINDFNTTTNNNEINSQKVLYLNFEDTPKRVINGQIFSITIKTLSTVYDFIDIEYELSNFQGLKVLSDKPYREEDEKYYYNTFYFLTTDKTAKIPDITASLVSNSDKTYKKTTIYGEDLDVITLNPKNDFSNIIAESFEILEYKTTNFDHDHNIMIFVAKAKRCNIAAFHLNDVHKQGVESITESFFDSKITYYAVINKDVENFSFSYFNIKNNKFQLINIPIIVNDDSVTTQSDLKPKDQSKEQLKIMIAAGVALLALLFVLWRKKYFYLIFVIIPLAYIAYIAIPSKEVCIKQGSNIQLLPVHNGTIFETTEAQISLPKEGSIKEFTKVKLQNDKIGWVKNEDLCKN